MAQQWDPTLPLEGTSRMKLITADAQFSVPFQLGRQRLRYTAAWRAQWNRTPLATGPLRHRRPLYRARFRW